MNRLALLALAVIGCGSGKKSQPAAEDLQPRWTAQRARLERARLALAEAPVAKACAEVPEGAIAIHTLWLGRLLGDELPSWIVAPIEDLVQLGSEALEGLPLRDASMEQFRSERERKELIASMARLEAATHLIVIEPDTYRPENGLGAWARLVPLDAGAGCAGYAWIDLDDDDDVEGKARQALAKGTEVPEAPPPEPAPRAVRDVDGDKLADFLIVENAEARLYRGAKGALPTRPSQRLRLVTGELRAAALVGDLDGDGHTDALVVGDDTQVYFARGGKDGLTVVRKALDAPASPPGELGAVIVALGDVDRDGFADALIGGPNPEAPDEEEEPDEPEVPRDAVPSMDRDPFETATGPDRRRMPAPPVGGAAYLVRGGKAGPAFAGDRLVAASDELVDDFARYAAGPGDVDGDGYADALIARYGGAQLHAGGAGGLATAPWDTGEDYLAGFVAAAGDLDADGLGDVIVGDQLRFGRAGGIAEEAVAVVGLDTYGAGDLDGDDIDDLVRTTSAGLEIHRGRSGAVPTSAAERVPYPFAVRWDDVVQHRVEALGDVDGDGRADLLVIVTLDSGERHLCLVGGGALAAPVVLAP